MIGSVRTPVLLELKLSLFSHSKSDNTYYLMLAGGCLTSIILSVTHFIHDTDEEMKAQEGFPGYAAAELKSEGEGGRTWCLTI